MKLKPVKSGKYKVIYADPPWSYSNKSTRGSADKHYPTMNLEDIKNLPVIRIADKDCALFMWATFPMLPEAIETMKSWGFSYKTVAFVWAKTNKRSDSWFWGLGNYTRSNPEVCLLGIKGNPKRVSASVHSLVVSPVSSHSTKPAEVRDRIVDLMGDVPRVELFARQTCEGWDSWGNEVEGVELF